MPQDLASDTLLKPLPPRKYFAQTPKKDLIVLHFTASYSWQVAHKTFMKAGRVCTPYIADLAGPKHVVKLYDDKYWSYHLGIKTDPEHLQDQRSIGIEIVNIGPVWHRDGKWFDYVGKEWPESEIIVGANRGADGGVRFPDEQVEAVCRLMNELCDRYSIPKRVPIDKTSCQLPQIGKFSGITTHQMFRKDKYDLGPAWPWEKMMELCGLEVVEI